MPQMNKGGKFTYSRAVKVQVVFALQEKGCLSRQSLDIF